MGQIWRGREMLGWLIYEDDARGSVGTTPLTERLIPAAEFIQYRESFD